MGLIDKVISEPLGGAHRDYSSIMRSVKKVLQESIKQLQSDTTEVLLEKRFKRLMEYGKFKEIKIK
jgi:acetyl-CoA carboxylase carboxyl transferase subunit alpha